MIYVTCVVGASNAIDRPIDVRLPKLFWLFLDLVKGVVEVPAVPHRQSTHRTRLKMGTFNKSRQGEIQRKQAKVFESLDLRCSRHSWFAEFLDE